MKTVIVGVDFTVVSDNAVKYAVAMANNLGCSLVLINVFQIPITFSEVPVVNPTLEELHDISKSKLENLKDNILHTDSNLKIFIESRLGSVSEEIFALSQKLNPIAIVVGSHSKTGMEEFFLGSNTMEIIKTSTYPVIIIPKGAVFHDVKRIGIATDLKNVVEETPSVMIKRFISEFNSKVIIINVDVKNKIDTEKSEEALMIDNLFYEYSPSYGFINDLGIEKGIEKYVADENIDLLITIPKKHSWFSQIFSVSNTKMFLKESNIPFVCIHA